MVVVTCSVPDCDFQTADVSEQLAIALLSNHGLAHQTPSLTPATNSAPIPRGPKLERPKVDVGITDEQWNIFLRRWEVFRTGSGIDDESAPSQLFQCAGADLGDSLLKTNPNIVTKTLSQILTAMRSLAVIPVATGVLRTELMQVRQERDEPIRAFAAKVRGKAETCAFIALCECGENVDYTDHAIRDVILNGIADSDIRREVLGTTDILKKPVNDVIALVENKEMARSASSSSDMSAMSSFQRQQRAVTSNQSTTPTQSDKIKQTSCPHCKTLFHVFTEGTRGWNSKPHQMCISCYRSRRRRKRQQRSEQDDKPTVNAVDEDPISQIAVLSSHVTPPPRKHQHQRQRRRRKRHPTTHVAVNLPKPATLGHHIFTKGEWRRARLRAHPRIDISISLANPRKSFEGGKNLISNTQTDVSAIVDTGAQSDLWSLRRFLDSGFSRDDLQPVTLSLSAANRSPIPIEGAFFGRITTKPLSGKATSSKSMIYVSSSVQDMYLSYETLLNLNVLSPNFPSTSITTTPTNNHTSNPRYTAIHPDLPSINDVRSLNDGCNAPPASNKTPCSCPIRAAPPPRPTALPFPCTPANNERMKQWLLQRYASSTFNTCPHRALPCMEGPPIEIHVDLHATPKACHTPANVPLHWQQRVHEDLIRDEALGVIERVPYGDPVSWCHRMVVTRKHDGSPRRTVDLSPLNKYCQRETFAMESPFHLARRVPKGTWKTVTDAWNGYHSVPLRESDRHLTTFITPFGRWRYTRAPQGFLSSGDGYNRRFDAILSSFERKERCVDDTIHYDLDLEQHWWRTIDLLTRVGRAGIVLNPDKFQFAERDVDFAGFRISDRTIEPLPKYLNAIREFPSPTSTTDIRSWFGLVNQVANYAQLRDTMAPFKPFLSPRCKFSWSPELESAFQASKDAIVDAIRHGVEIFDIQRRTCLRPDWSKRGIGYFLLQQHCSCLSGLPDCCPQGWRITLAGSRFLSSAEQRYAAIEGEALALAWGLEQTKYFTQGCDNLIIVTDHKPLVKIFGDRTLDEITNSRLFRLKQRTLPWRFEIQHLPGKCNYAADATSRHPAYSSTIDSLSFGSSSIPDLAESALMASIRDDTQELSTVSWSLLALETSKDALLSALLRQIQEGRGQVGSEDPAISPYKPIWESIYEQEGVLVYQDRAIVPSSLRKKVLEHLHAAHQGTSTMEQRARQIVYWPGMSNDIRATREQCSDCNRNAPSQAATPPLPTSPPSTPFEEVFADFFDYGGHHYLVVGDRLSGWVEVLSSTAGTNLAGAVGLIRHLRSFFATFGVPNELSSDGGPEFTASSTQDFFLRWGVRHRVSSAYFPQSNGRAEVAVKTAKRLLVSNTGPTGNLDNDRFLRAMLQLRNTPDPDCSISPAQIIFGRPLRDTFSFVNKLEKYSNPHIRPIWRKAWAAKEEALRVRMARHTESLTEHTRPLRPLAVGAKVFIQNQHGASQTKWDKSGVVVEALPHDQYRVKVDGSGRLTLRNRRFLRAYSPSIQTLPHQSITVPPPQQTEDQHHSPPVHQDDHNLLPSSSQLDPDSDPSASGPPPIETQPAGADPGPDNPDEGTGRNTDAPHPDHLDPPPPSPPQRPKRAVRPPRRYEPESGKWITE